MSKRPATTWVDRIAEEAAQLEIERYGQRSLIGQREAQLAQASVRDFAKQTCDSDVDMLIGMLRAAGARRDYEYIALRSLALHAAARTLIPPF